MFTSAALTLLNTFKNISETSDKKNLHRREGKKGKANNLRKNEEMRVFSLQRILTKIIATVLNKNK